MKGRWAFGAVVLLALLLLLSIPLAYELVAARSWRRIEVEAGKRAAELRGRDAQRPVLYGDSAPGNAWTYYSKAESLSRNSYWVYGYVEGRTEPDRESAQASLEGFLPALEFLQQGARRSDISRTLPWESTRVSFPVGRALACLGIARARFLAEEGREGEATDLLLDVMQYLMDATHQGSWWNNLNALSAQQQTVDELISMAQRGMLPRSHLAKVEQALGLLDDRYPAFGDDLISGEMVWAFEVLRQKTVVDLLKNYYEMRDARPVGWRYGFSDRLILGSYVELTFFTARRIAEADSLPWPEAQRVTKEACAVLSSTSNPLHKLIYSRDTVEWNSVQRPYREIRARFRIVQAAAHWLRTGELPDLKDPFGDRLQSRKSRHVLKIWSIGSDGVDDGGEGDWKPRRIRDIVLRVTR